jgi:hypothetical protein
MASVESAKVINDDEIDKARQFRDVLDQLKGAGESLSITLGETLVPALTDTAEAIEGLQGPLGLAKGWFDAATGAPVIKQIYDNVAPWKQLGTRIEQVGSVAEKVQGVLGKKIDNRAFDPTELETFRANLARVEQILADAAGKSDEFAASLVQGAIEEGEAAVAADEAARAHEGLQDAFRDAAEAAAEQREAMRDLRLEVEASLTSVFNYEAATHVLEVR